MITHRPNSDGPQQPEFTPVPLLDVNRGYQPLRGEILAAIERVCDSGRYVFGPDCEELEREVARLSGARHAVACASGSDAILLALMALDIGSGDEVICPSFTFFATASAVWRLGAVPVFVDIDPRSMNLDPTQVEAAITSRTKAIIPVHLFGQCAEMDVLSVIADGHGLAIIEDAAQAIGAGFDGRAAGSLGHMGCFSFYPTKNLGGMGDGGLITTQHEVIATRLKQLRNHGMHPRYYHSMVGLNSRLDSIQAAVLRVKLPHLETWSDERRKNARRYTQMFNDTGLDRILTLPEEMPGRHHVWNQYTVRVHGGRRDELKQHLADAKIGSEVYYPVPLHQQECFAPLGYTTGSLPETEKAAAEVLSLPIFPELTEAEQRIVVGRIAEYFEMRASKAA